MAWAACVSLSMSFGLGAGFYSQHDAGDDLGIERGVIERISASA